MEGYFNDLEMYDTQMVRVNSNGFSWKAAVGYRVKSNRGVEFRRWAKILTQLALRLSSSIELIVFKYSLQCVGNVHEISVRQPVNSPAAAHIRINQFNLFADDEPLCSVKPDDPNVQWSFCGI